MIITVVRVLDQDCDKEIKNRVAFDKTEIKNRVSLGKKNQKPGRSPDKKSKTGSIPRKKSKTGLALTNPMGICCRCGSLVSRRGAFYCIRCSNDMNRKRSETRRLRRGGRILRERPFWDWLWHYLRTDK